MSSKWVKKQLSHLEPVASAPAGSTGENIISKSKGAKKKKFAARREQKRQAAQKAREAQSQVQKEKLLEFYKKTSQPNEGTAELMAQVLASLQSNKSNYSDASSLAGVLGQILGAAVPPPKAGTGAHVEVQGLTYHPAGCPDPLLKDVHMSLPANKMGLLIGRSGSGKTTLLNVLAGLAEQTSGNIFFSSQPMTGLKRGSLDMTSIPAGNGAMALSVPLVKPSKMEERMQKVGLVFQFPERHFIGSDLMSELTFGWPRTLELYSQRHALAARLPYVMQAVGLNGLPIGIAPSSLSGGQQRKLALAVQLVRAPALLLLDEPLAGLDWQARSEVVKLLARLKRECTLLVVSHDLAEVAPLVDCAWRMCPGGELREIGWPPRGMDLQSLE